MSLPTTSNELAQDWIKNPDGSYSKRAGAVAGLRPAVTEPTARSERQNPQAQDGSGGVAIRVSLIVCRRRLLDEDNHIFSLKGLRDSITESLGFTNDNDPRLDWRYHQIRVERGESHGVIVKIERTE